METETNESDTYYTIKEASELLNIPASTLRYWEKQGIIETVRDITNGYRYYTSTYIEKLRTKLATTSGTRSKKIILNKDNLRKSKDYV